MPMVDADWTFDRVTANFRYVGDDHGGASPSYASVLEFHRWAQAKLDDEISTGDDELDISVVNATIKQTDNIITLPGNANIDDNASEHLYDGSIIQGSGTTQTIYDGFANFGNADVQIQIIQDGAILTDDWWNFGGAGLNPNAAQGISHRFMLPVRRDGADIDGRRIVAITRRFGKTFKEFRVNGTNRGNNTLALDDADDAFNTTLEATVAGWTNITNVTEGYVGLDVDNNAVNEFYYSEWDRDVQTINDLYERWKWLTRDGSASTLYGLGGEVFRGITHQVPYDALSGTFDELSDLVWGTEVAYDAELASGLTVGEYYRFATSGAVGKLLALDDNGTAGFAIFAIEPGTGTVVDDDAFTRVDGTATDGATVNVTINNPTALGGKGRILADNGVDTVWIQLLQGAAPVDNLPIWEATTAGVYDNATGDTALVNGSVTDRTPVSTPFGGASTGSAILGAYGVGVQPTDLTAADRVTSLANNNVSPPDFRTFTLGGLVIGEDRVLVAPWDGSTLDPLGNPAIDKDQLSLNTTLSGAAETAIVVTASIPADTPNSGTVRVVLDDGRERRVPYTSWTGSTFTIASTDFTGANQATAGNNVWISYLDLLATATSHNYTAVFSGTRNLVGLVRDGASTPIKEYIAPLTFPGSATAIRNPD